MGEASIKGKITKYIGARETERFAEEKYSLPPRSIEILARLYRHNRWVPIEFLREEIKIPHRSTFTNVYMNRLVREKYVKRRGNNDHTRDAIITNRGKKLVERIFA